MLSNQPVDDYPINLTAAYEGAAKIVAQIRSLPVVNWTLFRDSRVLDVNYWSGLWNAYFGNQNGLMVRNGGYPRVSPG